MRKMGAALLMLVITGSCNELNSKQELSKGKMDLATFDMSTLAIAEPIQKEFNVGRLLSGDSIEHIFEVRNNGTNPLVIKMVKASCGCTTVDWSRQPVLAGKVGWIRSRLKAGDPGKLRKSVVAQLNTKDPFMVFYLVGEVVAKSDSLKKTALAWQRPD